MAKYNVTKFHVLLKHEENHELISIKKTGIESETVESMNRMYIYIHREGVCTQQSYDSNWHHQTTSQVLATFRQPGAPGFFGAGDESAVNGEYICNRKVGHVL